MIRRPSHASSLSSNYSTNSSSSNASSSYCSLSSTSSSSSLRKLPALPPSFPPPPPPSDFDEEEDDEKGGSQEQVYVTSSSTILLGGENLLPPPGGGNANDDESIYSNTYDIAYNSLPFTSSTPSSSLHYACSPPLPLSSPPLSLHLSSMSPTPSLHYESAGMRSIFYEEGTVKEHQEISCFVEDSISDGGNETSTGGGHYEAIYEAISDITETENPPLSATSTGGSEAIGESVEEAVGGEDSFDSDDSDEAYSRLETFSCSTAAPATPSHSVTRHGSVSSNGSNNKANNKLAEAANMGMLKLRKNWSQKKTEVKSGLSKMKKRSSYGATDSNKSTENIYDAASHSASADPNKNRKWSFKDHFVRRKSTPSLLVLSPQGVAAPSSPALSVHSNTSDKETSTFYLTLTIEGKDRGELDGGVVEDLRSNIRGLGHISDIDIVRRPKSCSGDVPSSRQRSQSAPRRATKTTRPKNAPPVPPSESEVEDHLVRTPESDVPREKLFAMKLNQVLSAGPSHNRGRRRVLTTSEGGGGDEGSPSSSNSSPVPVLLTPETVPKSVRSPPPLLPKPVGLGGLKDFPKREKRPPPRSLSSPSGLLPPNTPKTPSGGDFPPEVTDTVGRDNVPHTRSSLASNVSSDGYMRPTELSSIPPPLPARPSSQQRLRRSNTSATDPTPSTPPAAVEDIYQTTHFADEPLYQFYTASVVERATCRQGECSSEDDYEVINNGSHTAVTAVPRLSAMEIVAPTDGRRTLWCELKEVKESGVLNSMSSSERKVQEAMFEVITSEASYLKSLGVLVGHFYNCPAFSNESVITKREKKTLFSDILPVKRCSEMFLADLEQRWQESFVITTLADIILKHASNTFSVYVKYCCNQIYQDRMLKQLRENNPRFVEILSELESSPQCQSLAMHSFLMLPMQRITRLPLLLDAIFHRLEHGSPHWHECNLALANLNKVVTECNEGARKMERMEEMLIISRQLDFREVRALPLISASRWLVKKGELTRLIWRDMDTKLTFGKRISKHSLYFFLFTDMLVVTKKKSEDSFTVLDHCPRNMVQVLELDTFNDKNNCGRFLENHKNLLIVTMLQNHENRTVEMVLSCSRESERTRWVEAVTPRTSDNPGEQIYEEWDCPQVQVTHSFTASQNDELSLEVSDVINVLKKMADGWYQGERIRDGERGWFPATYCKEVASAHVRARNLRQRYRLLALSTSIVEEMRRVGGEEEGSREDRRERRKTVTIQDMIGYKVIK